jgi:hypothetical protein
VLLAPEQNSYYSASYSTGSMQGRKLKSYPKNAAQGDRCVLEAQTFNIHVEMDKQNTLIQ